MDNQRGKTDDEIIWAYIAGFIDGEGCFSINKTPAKSYGRKFYRYVPRITITNTSVPMLRWLEEVFDKNNIAFHIQWRTVSQRERGGQKARKDVWNMCFYGAKRITRFLTPILPYLVLKSPQGKLMFDFCRYIIDRPRGNWKTKKERLEIAKLREEADLQTSLLMKKFNGDKFNVVEDLSVSPETVRQAHELYVKRQSELQ